MKLPESTHFWWIIAVLALFHWIILPILVVLLPFIILACIAVWIWQWLTKDEPAQ